MDAGFNTSGGGIHVGCGQFAIRVRGKGDRFREEEGVNQFLLGLCCGCTKLNNLAVSQDVKL